MDREQIKAAYEAGELRLKLNSIFPRGGPLYGQTKVTVRAEGLEDYVEVYPDPKCKFGGNDKIVDANYIKCTRKPLTFYEAEKGQQKNYTCIQCEDSPRYHLPEIISLSVSLTGKFDDVYSSRPFRYYTPARVDALYPRYVQRMVTLWCRSGAPTSSTLETISGATLVPRVPRHSLCLTPSFGADRPNPPLSAKQCPSPSL